jgi:serine/threonine protein kinase
MENLRVTSPVDKRTRESRRVRIGHGVHVIGRAVDCAIRVEDSRVSERHARLTFQSGVLQIEDLGSVVGTFVDALRVERATPFQPHQRLQVGTTLFEVRLLPGEHAAEVVMLLTPPPVDAAQAAATPLPPSLELLRRQRNYEVGAEFARGGMGAILAARDRNLRREVAMKVIPTEANAPENKLLRFVEEAQVTAQLEHPGIVPVHELGVDECGRLFYTMKRVKGVTLKQALEGLAANDAAFTQKFSLGQLLTVFQKICDAVGFAHSRGVLHRDLKPDNIMLGEFGETLVLDWGLAKLVAHREATVKAETSAATATRLSSDTPPGLTADGSVLGTPRFMSPEQAAGNIDALDERADIYALGAILYNMLTLQPSVEGVTVGTALRNTIDGRIVPPEQRAPGRFIPRELSAITMKCLATNREQRYRNVAALRRDIDLYLEGRSVSAQPDTFLQSLRRLVVRHKTVSIAAGIIVVISGVFTAKIIAEGRRAERALEDLRKTAPVHFAQALALVKESKFAEALHHVSDAIDFEPGNADYLRLKGQLCQTLLRLPEAREAFAGTLARNPSDTGAEANLKLCDEILQHDAGKDGPSPESMEKLVLALRAQGRFEEAIAMTRGLSDRKEHAQTVWKALLQKAGVTPKSLTVFDDGTIALDLRRARISDLAPLKDMPLCTLDLAYTGAANLEPLRGMRLESLCLDATKVEDLGPLHGMKLQRLSLNNTKVADLNPLAGMPLTELHIIRTPCNDLRPLKGMPLVELLCERSEVRDLTPLEGMPLEAVGFTPKNIDKGTEIIRGMKTIKRLTTHLDWPNRGWQKPDVFWKKFDAGEFN